MRVARNLICADTRELPAAAQAAAKRRFRVEGKRDIQTKVMTTLSTGVSRPTLYSFMSTWRSQAEPLTCIFCTTLVGTLDMNTLRALKRSPLGLDLYLWLTYRTFGLKRPLRLSWPQLYRQFGADPAKAKNGRTVDDFRKDCLREWKTIKDAWPDLHYQTVKGALLLSPSPPRIAPSLLRLAE